MTVRDILVLRTLSRPTVTPDVFTPEPPKLAAGVEFLGAYQGSGFTDASYLVRRPDTQVVQLSSLLQLVADRVDGFSSLEKIAQGVSLELGRRVSAGNVEYLLTNKLGPLGLLAGHEPECTDKADAILAVKLRHVLLAEPRVQFLGRVFAPLYRTPIIAAMVIALCCFDAWLFTAAPVGAGFTEVMSHPLLILALLAVAIGSALFHEVGHASACVYGGAKPGVIGMGIYVMWPAFYTNVTDSYRLSRSGRVRTDLGGVYFNGVFALFLAVLFLATGYTPLLWAVLLIHLEMAEQLVPSFRFDGYFILSDLAGVPDLFPTMIPVLRSLIPWRPADPRVSALKRGSRIAITSWVLLVAPIFVLEIVFIFLNAPRVVSTLFHSSRLRIHDVASQFSHFDVAAGLVSVISLILLVLPIAGLCYVLQLTFRRLANSAISASKRRPAIGYAFGTAALVCVTGLAAHWGLFAALSSALRGSHRSMVLGAQVLGARVLGASSGR